MVANFAARDRFWLLSHNLGHCLDRSAHLNNTSFSGLTSSGLSGPAFAFPFCLDWSESPFFFLCHHIPLKKPARVVPTDTNWSWLLLLTKKIFCPTVITTAGPFFGNAASNRNGVGRSSTLITLPLATSTTSSVFATLPVGTGKGCDPPPAPPRFLVVDSWSPFSAGTSNRRSFRALSRNALNSLPNRLWSCHAAKILSGHFNVGSWSIFTLLLIVRRFNAGGGGTAWSWSAGIVEGGSTAPVGIFNRSSSKPSTMYSPKMRRHHSWWSSLAVNPK